MLLVQTSLQRSIIPGGGLGLFAAEDIKSGEKIWEFNPEFDRVFTDVEVAALNEPARDFLNMFAAIHKGYYFLSLDYAKFINHSDEPNTIADGHFLYAKENISKGKEIVTSYFHFSKIDNINSKLEIITSFVLMNSAC